MTHRMYGMDYLLAEAVVPSLERLYISGVHRDPPGSHSADLIPRLFARNTQAPRLQRLYLVHLLEPPFKFDNLSCLHFCDIPCLEIQLPAVPEMVSCNSNLRELLLSQGLETPEFDLRSLPKPYVLLYSFRRFFIGCMSAPPVVYLLSVLKLEENGPALHLKDISNDTDIFAAVFPPTFPDRPSIFGTPKVKLDSTREYRFCNTNGWPFLVCSNRNFDPVPRTGVLHCTCTRQATSTPYVVKELWIRTRYHGLSEL